MEEPKLPERKTVRFEGYDYSSIGYYFITINAKNMSCIFGNIKDKTMYPNKLGEIIMEEWETMGRIRENVKLHEYVVMPNHFHAIVEICYSLNKNNVPGKFLAAHSLGAIVGSFKGAVTRRNNLLSLGSKKCIWHVRFYDRIIRNDRELINVKNYIENNVKNWKGI